MYIKDNHVTYKKKGNKDIIERERERKKKFLLCLSFIQKGYFDFRSHTHKEISLCE